MLGRLVVERFQPPIDTLGVIVALRKANKILKLPDLFRVKSFARLAIPADSAEHLLEFAIMSDWGSYEQ